MGGRVPVVAICERITQTRVSYVHAENVREALNEWTHGGEFDYDYLSDERQIDSKVEIITDKEILKVDAYHYDDEMPISAGDIVTDIEFD